MPLATVPSEPSPSQSQEKEVLYIKKTIKNFMRLRGGHAIGHRPVRTLSLSVTGKGSLVWYIKKTGVADPVPF
jgi:hypothetical protein